MAFQGASPASCRQRSYRLYEQIREAVEAAQAEVAVNRRRVHIELREQGWLVNHKRVLRLMRADNLLRLRRRKFILTTDSNHQLRMYPNLARKMVLSDIDQLWVAGQRHAK